jgi:regulator of sigma E protease
MNFLITVAATIVLLGVLITVHELGHFIVAKLSNVKVQVFSIGFGKPIWKVQRGETEYRIAQLPLGGYVRMLGMDPDEPLPPEDAHRAFNAKPPWVRIAIAAAGPAMNLALPFVILFPYFLSSERFDAHLENTIGAVDRGMPAGQAGMRAGDKIVAVDGEPIGMFWQVARAIDGYDASDGPMTVTLERAAGDRVDVQVTPRLDPESLGPGGLIDKRWRIGYKAAYLGADVAISDPAGPLARAGLRSFDRVLAVGGEETPRYIDVLERLAAVPDGQTVELNVERYEPLTASVDAPGGFLNRKQTHTLTATMDRRAGTADADIGCAAISGGLEADDPARLAWRLGVLHAGVCVQTVDPSAPAGQVLEPGDCILAINGERRTLDSFVRTQLVDAPEQGKALRICRAGDVLDVRLELQEVSHVDAMAGKIDQYRMGATLFPRADVPLEVVPNDDRLGFASYSADRRIKDQAWMTAASLQKMVGGEISPQQIGGPITISRLAGRFARQGLEHFMNLMVLISINLALLNLLPIPGLDGGHMLVAGVEMVIRRPLPEAVQRGLQYAGVTFIVMLVAFVLFNDVLREWRIYNG